MSEFRKIVRYKGNINKMLYSGNELEIKILK